MNEINELVDKYKHMINQKKQEAINKHDSLVKENCKDEADLERIKQNIYDVFTSMLLATQKQIDKKYKENTAEKYNDFCESYLKTFENVPASWVERLEKAKKFNNTIEAVIEETKLGVAHDLKNMFQNIM